MKNEKLILKAREIISNIQDYNYKLELIELEKEVSDSIMIFEIDRIIMENHKQIRFFNRMIEKWTK